MYATCKPSSKCIYKLNTCGNIGNYPARLVRIIKSYVQDRTIEAMIDCTSKNVYEDFLEFCEDKQIVVDIARKSFSTLLNRMYNLTTKPIKYKGKVVRVVTRK